MIRAVTIAAFAALTIATPAAAGSCCSCAATCAPPIVVYERTYQTPVYIVDQGPVYSGPGITTWPTVKRFHRPLADYPYVTHTYDYYPVYDAFDGRVRRHR